MGQPGKKVQRLSLDSGSLFDFVLEENKLEPVVLPAGFDSSQPEKSYCELVPMDHRKRFAQFFTPQPIAQLMIDWVFQIKPASVLDPSVGPGIFLRLIKSQGRTCNLTGIDVDPLAIAAARASLSSPDVNFISHDFLTWPSIQKFDGIVANPPYLRHHDIHYSFDIFSAIGRKNGIILTKLTNLYVLFILEICRCLSPGGRAAVIVPGEWTNANFGMALKSFLLSNGYLHSIIYFSNLSDQFEDALTTSSILLIEKSSGITRDSFDAYFIEKSITLDKVRAAVLENSPPSKGVIHRNFSSSDVVVLEKWDKVLKDGMAEHQAGFVPLREIAKSRRGIATGANEFFHLNEASIETFELDQKNLKSCVGRSEQVNGFKFTMKDFSELQKKNGKVWLLSFSSVPSKTEQKYIQRGVSDGLHERFLLAGRKPWYSMEQRPASPIWAAVFGRTSLRFIHNEAGVSNLTTFHCIYPNRTDHLFCRALVACLNSRMVQELAEHQRRVYGGGLIKFEPKDLLSIQVPNLEIAPSEVLVLLADMLDKINSAICEFGAVPAQMADDLDDLVRKAALLKD